MCLIIYVGSFFQMYDNVLIITCISVLLMVILKKCTVHSLYSQGIQSQHNHNIHFIIDLPYNIISYTLFAKRRNNIHKIHKYTITYTLILHTKSLTRIVDRYMKKQSNPHNDRRHDEKKIVLLYYISKCAPDYSNLLSHQFNIYR